MFLSFKCVLVFFSCLTLEPIVGILPTHVFNSHHLHTPLSVDAKYFETFIDHFNFADQRKFKLKYLIDEQYFKPDGPILFYTGNEHRIEVFAHNIGFIWDHAEELNATVVFAEHRYYGDSMPFGNISFQSVQQYGYLTSGQALMDYVNLIHALKLGNKSYHESPVIAIGGSYGGMLSAWIRQKYPNLIAGSIASSAPVWMFPNMSKCDGFNAVVTRTFNTVNTACVDKVKQFWFALHNLMQKAAPLELLSRLFQLCTPLSDVTMLENYLIEFLGGLAMFEYPYSTSFMSPLPAEPVAYFCNQLTDSASPDSFPRLISQFASATLSLANYSQELPCLNLTQPVDSLYTTWDMQTCMELTSPTCTSSTAGFFPVREWNQQLFVDQCQTKYKLLPRLDWADLVYWGKQLGTASNILFSNGDLDPWSAYGVLKQEDVPGCVVVNIPNAAHHYDLFAKHVNDSKDVLNARAIEVQFIKKCIEDWCSSLTKANT